MPIALACGLTAHLRVVRARDLLQGLKEWEPGLIHVNCSPSCGDGFSCLCYMLLLLLFEGLASYLGVPQSGGLNEGRYNDLLSTN